MHINGVYKFDLEDVSCFFVIPLRWIETVKDYLLWMEYAVSNKHAFMGGI